MAGQAASRPRLAWIEGAGSWGQGGAYPELPPSFASLRASVLPTAQWRGGQDGEARSGRALHACAYGECPGTLLHHALHPKEDGAWAGVPSGAPDSSEDGTRSRQCLYLTVTGAHRSPQTSAGPGDTCTAPATCSGISKTAQPAVPSMTQWSFLGPAVSQSVTRGLTAVDLGA